MRLIRRTPFDGALAVFVATAVVGVWAAYDRAQAMIKLGNIVAGVVVFYVLASQRRHSLWLVSGILGALASGVAVYFLLVHDWQAWPADMVLLTQIGRFWMKVRPNLPFPAIHPNIAGGLIVMLMPFQVAFGVYGWRKRRRSVWGMALILMGVAFFGLMLTSSRAALLALIAASGVGLLWLASDKLGRIISWSRPQIFSLLLVLMISLGVGLSFVVSDGPLALAGRLPGVNNTISRLDLFRHTLNLMADYPFTGGGLAAFPGLYSQYSAITPFFQFNYAHNFWLDVTLEQTAVGLLALLWLMGGSGVLLGRTIAPRKSVRTSRMKRDRSQAHYAQFRQELAIFRWATVIGLLVMALHGLVDDPLYGGVGTPLLFVMPGMATAVARKQEVRRLMSSPSSWKWGVTAVVLVVAAVMGARQTLTANWYANLGAVAMGQVELRNWPTNQWDDGQNAAALQPAKDLLQRALQVDPHNRTAQYRLGLAAMTEQDYEMAVSYLEMAYAKEDDHRGIQKSLGYSYVWVGEFDKAAVLLADIDEAEREMSIYSGWWEGHERSDLAAKAAKMVDLLNGDLVLFDKHTLFNS